VSYILDALKKAERDRRRTHVPSLGTMHALPVERRNVWPWVVGGLVAVNAIAFGVLFVMRSGAPVSAPPAPSIAAPAPPAIVAPAAPPVAMTQPTPAVATPPAPAVVAPAVPATSKSVRPAPRSEAPAARVSAVPPERSPVREKPVADRPGRLDPAALKLEVLVYADDGAQRSVWINGQRYVEGQRVDGRIVVEQILRDGVVLRSDTKRFVLRQE
jgi:hypothetical protein